MSPFSQQNRRGDPKGKISPRKFSALFSAAALAAALLSVPASAAADSGGAAAAVDADAENKEEAIQPGRDIFISSPDEMNFLLSLRRSCLPDAQCALAIDQPVSTHRELLPLASEMSALIAVELAQRLAICINDAAGQWSKLTGEPIPACGEGATGPHTVRIRLDPAGHGFLASLSFTENSPEFQGKASDSIFAPKPASLKLTTTFSETAEIPFVASRMADGLGNALGTEPPSIFDIFLKPPEPPSFHINLKLGNTLSSLDGFDFSAFTLRFDLEFSYYLRPYLLAFLEIGLAIGNASSKTSGTASGSEDEDTEQLNSTETDDGQSEEAVDSGSFSLVPVNFGLKFNPFYQYSVRPYLGLGIGLGILSDLVESDSRELTLSFSGILGVAWVPFNHLGFNLETSLNFDELRVEGGSNLLFGFSINFGVLVLF